MLKKLISVALITVFCASSMLVSATVPSNDDEKQAEKTRSEIRKLGIGPDARIELGLRDSHSAFLEICDCSPRVALTGGLPDIVSWPSSRNDHSSYVERTNE